MRWRNPKIEMPKDGETIAILKAKSDNAHRTTVTVGRVVFTPNDEDSCGIYQDGENGASPTFIRLCRFERADNLLFRYGTAWLPIKEFTLPYWCA